MFILLRKSIHSMKLLSTSQLHFFQIEQTILNFAWNYKRSQLVKEILRKKVKAEFIMSPDFQLHYKAIVKKTICIIIKTDMQISGIKQKTRNKPHTKGQYIYDKGRYTIGKGQSLQQVVLGKQNSHQHNTESGPRSHTLHKNEFGCSKHLNARPEAIRLLKENIGHPHPTASAT